VGAHARDRASVARGIQNPTMFLNIEETCKRLEAWREKRAPGSTAAMRSVLQQESKLK